MNVLHLIQCDRLVASEDTYETALTHMLTRAFTVRLLQAYESQRHEISDNVVCATSKVANQPKQMRSLIRVFDSRLIILKTTD